MGYGDDHVAVGYFVLRAGLAGESSVDLCAACVAVFVTYFFKLCADDCAAHLVVVEYLFESVDLCEHFVVGLTEFVLLQSGELFESHFDDCGCLAVGESETFGESCSGVVGGVRSADYLDDLVDILRCDDESF